MFITRMEKMALFAKCNTLMIAHTLSAFEIFKSCYLGRKKKKKNNTELSLLCLKAKQIFLHILG